jgi:hypothetical protein
LSDTKTSPSISDSNAIGFETIDDRLRQIAALTVEMAKNYKQLAEQSNEHYTVSPVDAIPPKVYEAIEQGYIALSAFQSFVEWLIQQYDDEVHPPEMLSDALVFMLGWIKVYEEEKAGQA